MTLDLQTLVPNIILLDINKNNKNTYISQLTILTIKSLLPMKQSVANRIDYSRFKEELKLWEEYCQVDNIYLTRKQKDYFSFYDEFYYTRLIPIIVANKDFSIIEDEIIKNILYFSADIENLLEWLLIGVTIFLLINDNKDIINCLKEYIIKFSQIDLLSRYEEFFQVESKTFPNVFRINFEKERIGLLDVCNRKKTNKYRNIQDILMLLEGDKPNTDLGRIIFNSSNSFITDGLEKKYMDMNNYILNLRRGRINLESLKINEYVMPDVFSFEEGDVFYHSLLNYSKVLKKEVTADGLTSLIGTKSGNYLFKRNPSN